MVESVMEFTIVYFVMDLLLHIALIGVALPAMFFTVGTQIQHDVMRNEVYKVTSDLLRPLMGIVSYVVKDVNWEIEATDAERQQEENNRMIRDKVRYGLIGLFCVSLALFFVVVIIRGGPFPWDLVLANIIMVIAIILAEIFFLYVIVKRFRPIDVDDIQKRLIARLEGKHITG